MRSLNVTISSETDYETQEDLLSAFVDSPEDFTIETDDDESEGE